jgi:AraC-like DNA-binding protein
MNPQFPASSAMPPHLRAALGQARLRAAWNDDGLLRALGVGEPMPAGLVRRLGGTGDLFLACFHQPVQVRLSGGLAEVPANTLVAWRPGMAQEYGRTGAAWLHSWLHLRGAAALGLAESAGLPFGAAIALPEPQLFESALADLHVERRRQQSDAVVIEALVTVLLRRLARHAPAPADGLAEVHRRIREQPGSRHRLADLAALAGCSVPHLCAAFRKRYGVTPVAFALDGRIRQAARLIRAGEPASVAAARCGWADVRQFARVFKARLGVTPGAYR